MADRIIAYGLFIDPPLGRVGMTEKEARECGRNVLIGKMMMTRVARAPYTVIKNAMHIHSTVTELIPTLLCDLKPLS